MTDTYVVAGAGLAGAKAVETLREEGFDGRLVMIGAEPERPYERPPLSKDYLCGEAARESIYVQRDNFYAEHGVELRLGRRAVVVGAGWIGCEVAAAARMRGLDVTVLDAHTV